MVICSHSVVKSIDKLLLSGIYPIIICLMIMSGCNSEERVEEEKMVLIYTDLLIAQDTTFVNETSTDSLISAILKRHNVSEDKYEKTIEYYNADVKRWEAFFDKVTTHIDSLSKASPN